MILEVGSDKWERYDEVFPNVEDSTQAEGQWTPHASILDEITPHPPQPSPNTIVETPKKTAPKYSSIVRDGGGGEGATSSSDFANTNYDWAVEGFIFNGPAASTNTTQTGFFRSSNRLYTVKDPLLLASGGYTSANVAHDFYYDYTHSNRIYGAQLEYSASGVFNDTQVVKKWVSEDYTVNQWHSVSETLDPGTYSFTDTAKIRIRSGGWANSTHSWHDNIVITGEAPAAIPEPSFQPHSLTGGGFFLRPSSSLNFE